VMEAIGLGGDENGEQRLAVLRAIDKRDKFGVEGVRQLLGKGRMDESGDFTQGVGLEKEQIESVVEFCNPNNFQTSEVENGGLQPDNVKTINYFKKLNDNSLYQSGLDELHTMAEIFSCCGYGPGKHFSGRIHIDPSVVRGLEYYTGPVYECELTFPVTNEKGETVTFGSVAGGGRYDGLVKRFTGQDIPATGFSIGVSRLMTALKNLGKLETGSVLAPVVVCVMDRDIEALAGYQAMVQELRKAGIRAEMYQGNPKQFGKQLQYADRRGSPIAIIQGSDERAAGEVQVKDLVEGMRLSLQITDNEEWRATRPAQQTIQRDQLVETVRHILDQQMGEQEV
jgi:histidyl-tRNA synthetase